MAKDKYLIWWTSQEDCERVEFFGLADLLNDWPPYLRTEFASRNGRSGRGRLWVSGRLKDAPSEVSVAWSNAVAGCAAAKSAGGIVIKAEDVTHIQFLPGFVTTYAMELPTA